MHDMSQAVKSNDSCLVFRGKYVIDIEKQLNGDFTNICEWFVDYSLSIPFCEEAAIKNILWKKELWEISQNSHENTCARVSLLINLQA